jgi:hypothetical protein
VVALGNCWPTSVTSRFTRPKIKAKMDYPSKAAYTRKKALNAAPNK